MPSVLVSTMFSTMPWSDLNLVVSVVESDCIVEKKTIADLIVVLVVFFDLQEAEVRIV